MEAQTLRIAEALPQDAGRSIARLDPDIAQKNGLKTGDVVFLEGERRTVASVYPGYPQDAGTGQIRIDGTTRRNAGAGIDDRIKVWRADVQPASMLTLAPVEDSIGPFDIAAVAANYLVGRPATKGDAILLEVMGQKVTLVVTGHRPSAEAVLVTPTTKLEFSDKPAKGAMPGSALRVSYEDIGGLAPQIRKVREMIELPLRHPEVFERLGIQAPKGVLLHGPPGTGKTLLAKAVANETHASFFSIGGPEIVSKFVGGSEENLRQVFDQAREQAPSIIFIDELDSIAPKRDEVGADAERRLVAQLLTLMDGLEERGRVVVIGATNRPDALDPALRRPGRFDREVEIGVPDRDGRLQILHVHARGMPLDKTVDLAAYAGRTHGFVGADLAALCREAGMRAIRRLLPSIDLTADKVPPEVIENLVVTRDDFEGALTELAPSALREVLVERPDVTWDQVGGLDGAKQELVEAVEWPLKYGRIYEHMKAQAPKGVLLHGPPGTGKTLLAKALAHEAGVNFISVKGPELLSKWVGESERGVREVFRKARQSAPCVVFLDEVDALVPMRGHSMNDSGVTERVVSQFLTELDGLETLRNVVVVGATNRYDLLDPALLRPGRFDRVVEIGLPDERARRSILGIHTRRLPLAKGVDLEEFVKKTDGWSGADLASLAQEASLLAIREFVKNAKDPDDEKTIAKAVVTQSLLREAFEKVAGRKGRAISTAAPAAYR
jgi:transitional endoplasmic reticulum ATPase